MAVTVTLNGVNYTIPSPGESNDWGAALNAYLVALATSGGGLALTTVGATPNANGASFASGVLRLQPASQSFPGAMTAADKASLDGLYSVYGNTYRQNVSTGDATPTAIPVVQVSGIDEVWVVESRVTGTVENGGNCASYGLVGVFKNIAGTLTQIGSTTVLWSVEQDSAWAAVFTTSADVLQVTVTGAAATNISWVVQSWQSERVAT